MTDDRLTELGLTRRPFLKKMIAGTFMAPVIVSFGLDGIAEAHPNSPSQCFPNQFAADRTIRLALEVIENAKASGDISPSGIATSLSQKLKNAQNAEMRGNFKAACGLLGATQSEINAQAGHHISSDVAGQLSELVSDAQSELECACFQA